MPFLIMLGVFMIFMQMYTIVDSENKWIDFKARCEERNGSAGRTRDGNHLCVKKEQVIVISTEDAVEDKPKDSKDWWKGRGQSK